MPRRILALEITDWDLKATILQTTFRDYRVAGFYRQRLESANGTQIEQVSRFVSEHAEAGDTVLSALPGDRVSWRRLVLPFRDHKRLAQTIPFELESNVPFGLDEVVFDYQVLHRDGAGTTVLAALVPKNVLQDHLQLLHEAGVDPKVVDLGPLATLNTLRLVPSLPPTFAFIDVAPHMASVALYRDGALEGLRTIRYAGEDVGNGGNGLEANERPPAALNVGAIRWTLLAMNGAPLEEQLPCYVAGDPTALAGLCAGLESALSIDLRRLDQVPLRNVGSNGGANAAAFSSGLGLGLREAVPANALGLNFRRGEFTFHRGEQELRRGLRAVAALAALVVALTVADLYMEYRYLARREAAIDAQIQKISTATLPDMGRVANPGAQLQAEIDVLREAVELLSGVVPLSTSTGVDVLREVSAAIPNKIRIDSEEYTMDPESVRLRANTDTFESVDAIKQRLLNTGWFSDVVVKDAKAAKGGEGVNFRMTLIPNKDLRARAERQ